MKKYVIQPGKNTIDVVDVLEPVVGPNEIKVRVKAASLNYRDILNLQFSKKEIIPFSDGAGEVVEVGDDVTDFVVGDRVTGLFFPTWIEGNLNQTIKSIARGGGKTDGMLAEFVVDDQKSFISFPEHLTYEQASTLPCAGLTAWHGLFEHGQPAKEGQTVLIQGTGGVSIFALQLAVAHGVKTIVTSSSDEKLETAKKMGATHTINYRKTPDWDAEVLRLTDNIGVDMVLEVGGAGTFEKSMTAVKVNGVISSIGVLSGLEGKVNSSLIVAKSLQIFGIYVGSKAMQCRFHSALSEYSIMPVIDRIFGFDEATDAYAYQKSGSHLGKVVVKCG